MIELISSCLSPVRTFNRHTKEWMYCDCGKCVSCMNQKASKQSIRVNAEIKSHPYSIFFTLTYDNDHVPRMEAIQDKNGVIQLRPIGRIEYEADSCPLNYIKPNGDYLFDDDVDLPTIENDKIGKGYEFAVVHKPDIQNFMKRLRYKIDKLNLPNYEKKIRYYIASEYGPSTKRPHYHGIIFTDSQQLLEHVKNFIVDSWGYFRREKRKVNVFNFEPMANVLFTRKEIKLCDPNTAYYVAEYVAGNLDLPIALRQRCTKPFHLQSKNPVIGSYTIKKEEVFENVERGVIAPPRAIYNVSTKSTEIKNVLYSSDILFSLFRKCFGYSTLSLSERFDTYAFFRDHLEEWKDYIKEQIIIYNYDISKNSKSSIFNIRDYIAINPQDSYRNWCSRMYSDEYTRLYMDKDATWYASKKAYHITKQFDFNRYYPYCDCIHAYVCVMEKCFFLLWHYKQAQFYERFNKLVDKVGFETTMLHAYPFMFESVVKRDNDDFFLPHRKVFQREMNKGGKFMLRGTLLVNELRKKSISNTSVYDMFVNEQRKKMDKRNKSKKINNTYIGGVRKMS